MRHDLYEIDFTYQGELHPIELTVVYSIYGSNRVPTHLDPEEVPEAEIKRILYKGKELVNLKADKRIDLIDTAYTAIDDYLENEMEYDGIDC